MCRVTIWRSIQLDSNYEVNTDGEVRRRDTGRVLKQQLSHRGYLMVTIRIGDAGNRKTATASVHRLVAHAFLGPCPDGLQVNHKDGNKGNPSASNLEYVTPSENILDAVHRIGRKEWASRRSSLGAEHRAKTHCPNGHLYSGTNLIPNNQGRKCRACKNEKRRVKK